jgi:hypothetical protein
MAKPKPKPKPKSKAKTKTPPAFFSETDKGLPTNPVHRTVFLELKRMGFQVARRAFPHFAAFNPETGRLCMVIARNTRGRTVRRDQRNLARLLMEHGIEVLFYNPNTGWKRMQLQDERPKTGEFPEDTRLTKAILGTD